MKRFLASILILAISADASSQSMKFRSGVFLHHSTGGYLWNYQTYYPADPVTNGKREMRAYNLTHGFTGADTVRMSDSWYPTGSTFQNDNPWHFWRSLLEGQSLQGNYIMDSLNTNKIIMIKTCYPAGEMTGVGSASDTLAPATKSLYNYKWHWRAIVRAMRNHPNNFFVIWTNAPSLWTNSAQALLSHQFSKWAKDTLATGHDPIVGVFPRNIYVFDYFHKLATEASAWKLPAQYAIDGSHVNASAVAIVTPQLVNEMFDAALAYEALMSVGRNSPRGEMQYRLEQNYPNPFNPETDIRLAIPIQSSVKLQIYNVIGQSVRTLLDQTMSAGEHTIRWNGRSDDNVVLPSGVYLCLLQGRDFLQMKKMLLMK